MRSLPLPVLARLQAEAGMPFNVLQGPLVRVLLVRLGSSDHLILLTMHHAVCDGWSFKVGAEPSACLPPPGVRFPDVHLPGGRMHASESYIVLLPQSCMCAVLLSSRRTLP